MDTLLLLKPSPLQSHRHHQLLSRSFPHSRRRSAKLGIRRLETPRCALGDPFHVDSFLLATAAAAAAVSVIRVIYTNTNPERQNDRPVEVSNTGVPHNTSENGDGDWGYCHANSEFSLMGISETTHLGVLGCKEMGSFKTKSLDLTGGEVVEIERDPNMIPMSHMVHSHLEEFSEPPIMTRQIEEEITREVVSSCFPKMLIDTKSVELDIIKELLLCNRDDSEVSLFSGITNQYSPNAVISHANRMLVQVIGDNTLLNETPSREHLAATSTSLLIPVKNSHALDEATQMKCPPMSYMQNLSQITRGFSLQDKVGLTNKTRSSSKRFWIPESGSVHATETVEKLPLKEVIAGGGTKDGDKNSRDINRRVMDQRNSRDGKAKRPLPIGMIAEDDADISFSLFQYNRLLREERLTECVDFLESLEMKGLLDMDKVYHTKFLKICKAHKAVKEAFRFTKLIKNPTLSTFNMLLSVCACSQNYEGALQVLLLVKDAGLRPDCQLYTTLISTCSKSGKVDAMFEVFHEMVNAGVEPNLHTYGALIDGCARSGQVAKAFGAYGIMRSKNVKPDRVIFNALITACGQSGAMHRAFDVLAEMRAEPQPIEPDHVTVGALIKTCIQAGQADRAREVYKMLQQYKIKGTTDVYTIAVNSCSLRGDLEFALSIYDDMRENGIVPDEMFFSTIFDVAGHAGKLDTAFEILKDAKMRGLQLGIVSYSSLMGACSKAKDWQKALELLGEIKSLELQPTASTMNALFTTLCDGNQLLKAATILKEMKEAGVHPNTITYSILLVACEKNNEIELGFDLLSQAKQDGIRLNSLMCRCLTGLCLKRYEKACALGEPVLSFNAGRPQIDSKWMKWALMVYRESISDGLIPSSEVFAQVLGCLKFPNDISLRQRFVENLGFSQENLRHSNLCSLLDGFGEYDPRAFSICEEASSLGIVPCISYKDGPIVVDARKLKIQMAEVYIITILKGLKHRLAAGARLPNMTILLPIEKTQISFHGGERNINLSGRVGQAITALLRRLGLHYQGVESSGKIRINGLSLRRWFKPKIAIQSFGAKPADLTPSQYRFAKEIANQQRSIRSNNNFSLQ